MCANRRPAARAAREPRGSQAAPAGRRHHGSGARRAAAPRPPPLARTGAARKVRPHARETQFFQRGPQIGTRGLGAVGGLAGARRLRPGACRALKGCWGRMPRPGPARAACGACARAEFLRIAGLEPGRCCHPVKSARAGARAARAGCARPQGCAGALRGTRRALCAARARRPSGRKFARRSAVEQPGLVLFDCRVESCRRSAA